jgi:hypothetical protein
MKKTYINPNISVIRLHATNLLMQTSQVGIGESLSTASGAESRRFDFDDEE